MTHRKPPSRLANAVAGLGAQVFSSLNSFLIIIISARFLELGVHGHFVFGVALCQIVLSLVRALCGETVVVLSTRGDDTTDDEGSSEDRDNQVSAPGSHADWPRPAAGDR